MHHFTNEFHWAAGRLAESGWVSVNLRSCWPPEAHFLVPSSYRWLAYVLLLLLVLLVCLFTLLGLAKQSKWLVVV